MRNHKTQAYMYVFVPNAVAISFIIDTAFGTETYTCVKQVVIGPWARINFVHIGKKDIIMYNEKYILSSY